MVHHANELRLKLTHLTLWGQNEDGGLDWAGTLDQWHDAECDIHKDHVTIISKSDNTSLDE